VTFLSLCPCTATRYPLTEKAALLIQDSLSSVTLELRKKIERGIDQTRTDQTKHSGRWSKTQSTLNQKPTGKLQT
jgi:hypothetical protein